MVDLSDFFCEYEEGINGVDIGEEIVIMLDLEVDCIVYNDEIIVVLEEIL